MGAQEKRKKGTDMKTVMAAAFLACLARPALAHCVNGDDGCVEHTLTLAQARASSESTFESQFLNVTAETDWDCVIGGQGATCTRWVRVSGELSSMECFSSESCYYDPDWGSQVCDVTTTCEVSSDAVPSN